MVIRWNTTEQGGQKFCGKQTGWAYYQSFQLDLMGEEGEVLCDRERPRNTVISGNSKDNPQNCPKGSLDGSSEKVMLPKTWLKCLSINACSLRNKQKELQPTVQLENCEPTEIIEMWWDDSHDQNMMIEVGKKDRKGKRGRGVALYLKRYIECKELPLRNSHEQVESLWVKVRDWTSKGHLVDKAFLLQLQEVLCSQVHICWGISTTYLDVCWKSNTAACKQSSRHLELRITSWTRYCTK